MPLTAIDGKDSFDLGWWWVQWGYERKRFFSLYHIWVACRSMPWNLESQKAKSSIKTCNRTSVVITVVTLLACESQQWIDSFFAFPASAIMEHCCNFTHRDAQTSTRIWTNVVNCMIMTYDIVLSGGGGGGGARTLQSRWQEITRIIAFFE